MAVYKYLTCSTNYIVSSFYRASDEFDARILQESSFIVINGLTRLPMSISRRRLNQ
jgi:hypothetical protein